VEEEYDHPDGDVVDSAFRFLFLRENLLGVATNFE
jgi:hypothetical protein